MPVWRAICACAAIAIAACGSGEVLQPRSALVPAGVDFSGRWQLREGQPPATVDSRTDAGLVSVFLESGDALKITQTPDGIFISFDRAIVEEYRFGEQREINVGPVVADRVSGWDGASYVVETLDDDGARLVETYRLMDRGNTLVREVVIRRGEKRKLDLRQIFDKR